MHDALATMRTWASAATRCFAVAILAANSYAQIGGQFSPTMVVHADPTNEALGWVTDGVGQHIYGGPPGHEYGPPQPYPLVWALEHTGPVDPPNLTWGRRIGLATGRYAAFSFETGSLSDKEVASIDSTAQDPVIVYGGGSAVIAPAVSKNYTMSAFGKVPGHTFHHIRWQGVTWEASSAAAIVIGGNCDAGAGIVYEDWRFIDCEVDGLYDHMTGTGPTTMWGLQLYSIADFQWRGGSVHDLTTEHAFYIHNAAGDVLITGTEIWEVGRTAIQIVARLDEGGCGVTLPPNPGDITITGNRIADVGLAPADYHGGTAISINGRQDGFTQISGNRIEFGLDTYTPGLKAAILAKPNYPFAKPYGTGAILFWTDVKDGFLFSNQAEVSRNEITYASDSGDREAVILSALNSVTCFDNTIQMGARTQAIEVGNYDSPGDIEHPLPLAWCIRDNTLIPGSAGAANLCIEALCCGCAQPQSSGMTCP